MEFCSLLFTSFHIKTYQTITTAGTVREGVFDERRLAAINILHRAVA